MLIATLHEAMTTLVLAGMLLGGSALTVALAAGIIHAGRRRGRVHPARIVIAGVLVFSSVPGWFSGGLLLLAALVVAKCPEARDCLF
jgi:hypothetical protein